MPLCLFCRSRDKPVEARTHSPRSVDVLRELVLHESASSPAKMDASMATAPSTPLRPSRQANSTGWRPSILPLASWTPAKTLILKRISSRNPTAIAENYFSLTRISKVFADVQLGAEACALIGDIITTLLPRGWFPIITPGGALQQTSMARITTKTGVSASASTGST